MPSPTSTSRITARRAATHRTAARAAAVLAAVIVSGPGLLALPASGAVVPAVSSSGQAAVLTLGDTGHDKSIGSDQDLGDDRSVGSAGNVVHEGSVGSDASVVHDGSVGSDDRSDDDVVFSPTGELASTGASGLLLAAAGVVFALLGVLLLVLRRLTRGDATTA